MTLAPGTTLASYTIERLLGRGGMGEVYLATDAELGRKVALKLLAPGLAGEPRVRQRFIAESRLAAALDHPHIVPLYEAGESDGRLFLAMRYVDGADLGAVIGRDGRLAPGRAVELLTGIGQALDAAHDRGLIHRDVKPGNILVARTARAEEHAYLADFGLVKEQGSAADFSRTGQLLGSVDYVAPEMVEGRPIDGRVDVYSLACVLYACLTGGPPYPRETDMATLWAHVQAAPPRPSDTDPALAPFDAVIAAGMAKDPTERSPTGGELLAAARAATVAAVGGHGGEAGGKWVGQAGTAGATATVPRPSGAPNQNLPLQLSSFVGRARELRDLVARMRTSRLVTLTGPGGTGKTRLAIHAATDVAREFADGVFLVDCASIADVALVPSQVASALGAVEASGQSAVESLVGFLGGKRLLLVLDNLEQVPRVGPFVGELVARCPAVQVLVTSRTPLHLQGEAEFAVSPLGVPDGGKPPTAAEIARSDAVALFAARASAVRADFHVTDQNAAAVAAICVRVDGLPLAIELAAARVKLLSPRQILDRLDHRLGLLTGGALDLPKRQRTLRATIAWSHDLLGMAEQRLFRRLAVFDGGFTFAAAEAIGRDDPTTDLLEGMTTLVDGNLLRPVASDDDQARFAMLETIREYAAEQLAASDEGAAIARRHFDYYADFVREFEALGLRARPDRAVELDATVLKSWLVRLDRERPNLSAAMAWALGAGEHKQAARMFESLRDYTRARGRTAEARSLAVALLATPDLDDAQRGRLLHDAAVLAARQGDLEPVDRFATELLELARRLGDHHLAVGAGQLLSMSAGERGDIAAEEALIREMLADADRTGDPRMEILARSDVALRSLRLEDFDQAATFYREILARVRRTDVMRETLSTCLLNVGLADLHAGRLAMAAESLAESAAIGMSMGDPDLLGYVLEGYAALAAATGRFRLAATLQGASSSALAEAGSALEAFEARMSGRTALAARAALGDAAFDTERSAGAELPLEGALALATTLGQELAMDPTPIG